MFLVLPSKSAVRVERPHTREEYSRTDKARVQSCKVGNEKNWQRQLGMHNFIKADRNCFSQRCDMKFPVQIVSKGQTKDVQCR